MSLSVNSPKLKTKTVAVNDDVDVAYAALAAKNYAKEIGFSTASQYMISTAVSELARNMFIYAKKGIISMSFFSENSKSGIEIVAEDFGPGIQDIDKAMEENFSTGGTMGVGLPGTKRLMDYFKIESKIGVGTKVVTRKWN
ncbi:MAG: serine/threonine-protein kinase RsbT [Parvicella sp.]|jgi:serine/threonine-protein kinase RsbT